LKSNKNVKTTNVQNLTRLSKCNFLRKFMYLEKKNSTETK